MPIQLDTTDLHNVYRFYSCQSTSASHMSCAGANTFIKAAGAAMIDSAHTAPPVRQVCCCENRYIGISINMHMNICTISINIIKAVCYTWKVGHQTTNVRVDWCAVIWFVWPLSDCGRSPTRSTPESSQWHNANISQQRASSSAYWSVYEQLHV